MKLKPSLPFERFERMTRELGDITAETEPERRLTLDGQDELTALTREINRMLEALEVSNRELREKEERLRALALHLQNVQEQESQRISHRIHNDLGQMLIVLNIELSAVARALEPGNKTARAAVQRTVSLLQQTMQEAQTLARHLRPRVLDELDFQAAVEWLMEDLGSRSGLRIVMEGSFEQWTLDKEAATALFRIIQESLLNVVRHAQADAVHIGLACRDRTMHLDLVDDGIGFKAETGRSDGFGLDMMRERAECMGGMVKIMLDKRGECGTRVRVRIPCSEQIRFNEVKDDANISCR